MGPISLSNAINTIVNEDFQKILIIALVGGLIIIILAFGTVVASLIPLAIALASIFAAIGAATLVSRVQALNIYYYEMIILMGLAVGIDYSLFIVNRFRDERAAGRSKMDAIRVSCDTTGKAVFYAGIIVVVSVSGLVLTGDNLFIGLGLGALIVVLFSIIASMTLLPALISALDHRLNWLRIPGLGRPSSGKGIWGTISNAVLARPAIYASVTLAVLVALSIPLFSLHIGDQSINGFLDWEGAAEERRAF